MGIDAHLRPHASLPRGPTRLCQPRTLSHNSCWSTTSPPVAQGLTLTCPGDGARSFAKPYPIWPQAEPPGTLATCRVSGGQVSPQAAFGHRFGCKDPAFQYDRHGSTCFGSHSLALPRHSDPMEWLTLGHSPNKRCLSSNYALARLKEAACHASSFSGAPFCPAAMTTGSLCTRPRPLRHPLTRYCVQHVNR